MDYHLLRRRIVQVLALLTLAATPITGLFRLDIPSGNAIVMGRMLWFQESYLIGLALLLIFFLFVSLIKIAGRVPCGWACPRNTVVEAINRILGPKTAPLSRKLPGMILLVPLSLAVGVINLSYFYDWRYLLQSLWEWNGSTALIWVLFISVLTYLDLFLVRHAFCYVGCPYGLMQKVLGDEKTMALHYDQATCVECDGCIKACFMEFDPRTHNRSICVACGDCISACEHALREEGLSALSFAYGSRAHFSLSQVLKDSRFLFMAGGVLVLAGALIVGVFDQKPISVAVSKSYLKTESTISVENNMGINRFQMIVNNSSSKEKNLTLEVTGMDKAFVEFEQNPVLVGPGQDAVLRLTFRVPRGAIAAGTSVPFTLRVNSTDPKDPVAEDRNVFFMPQIP